MELNKDIEQRDKLIFGRYRPRKYQYGNAAHFDGLAPGTLAELISRGFIDPEGRVGSSPTAGEVCEFVNKYNGYTVHGYSTSSDGVCVEGVDKACVAETPEECQEFLRLFGDATELSVNGFMYAWYGGGER